MRTIVALTALLVTLVVLTSRTEAQVVTVCEPTTTYYAPAPTTYYAPTTSYYAPTTAYFASTVTYYAAPYANYYAPVYGRPLFPFARWRARRAFWNWATPGVTPY